MIETAPTDYEQGEYEAILMIEEIDDIDLMLYYYEHHNDYTRYWEGFYRSIVTYYPEIEEL